EPEPMAPQQRPPGDRRERRARAGGRRDMHVVRVKLGTEHATVYRRGGAAGSRPQGAWSVRGHWRRQPYASLGVDEHGRALTKLIWIASYTKNGTGQELPASKIIEVR